MLSSTEKMLIARSSVDYELLDSGDGEKLERYGGVLLSRPDPQALWQKLLSREVWNSAHARFERASTGGKWKMLKDIPDVWNVTLEGVTCTVQLSSFKHVGIFPEQSPSWKWLQEKIKKETDSGRKVSVLNLFGYTGGASIACALAGAEVCHVDSSEYAVDLAMKNRDASGIAQAPIRFIVDDVRKFVEREIKRGNTYDVILMDPPVYGKGAKDEVWKIEEDLLPLLVRIQKIISPQPVAVVLNGYASGYSHVTYAQMLESAVGGRWGTISSGEMAIQESDSKRLLPCGIFARWEK
ncbi:MAG: class I SAM-dependent methyltransferase [Patescibacteria group bacterium]